MKLLCTYCSGPKREDSGSLPAARRYLSERIAGLANESRARGEPWRFRILSGRFGLLAPDEPIPWYDHLLRADEVAALVPSVARRLAADGATVVEYHTADPDRVAAIVPYLALITGGCASAGAALEVVILPGDPA